MSIQKSSDHKLDPLLFKYFNLIKIKFTCKKGETEECKKPIRNLI